ncbi:hypothetical protein [Pseudooceanicola aestuarii]|uniref:hypothetical protein n=1 Tax=Pseudooceanicola aestuarii TaxID=2697319 RepID=UPI0013D6BBC3|nr:hypothetical protein [Pseudooceanicola aestuarii]
MRTFAAAIVLTCLAAPAMAQEVVENEVIKVFAGQWVQSKDPAQNGLLMYLTEDRARAGEYFSIRCEDGDRSVRLGFAKQLPKNARIKMLVDDTAVEANAAYTGDTQDASFAQGSVHGYRLDFADANARDGFLDQLGQGRRLAVGGQKIPLDLTGAGPALREQAAYCR